MKFIKFFYFNIKQVFNKVNLTLGFILNATVKIAIIGIGNCSSSLIQGIEHYRNSPAAIYGHIFKLIGGYRIEDIEVVLAYDVDERKVARDLSEAIFVAPNNALVFHADVPPSGVAVKMGRVLDGVAPHMEAAGGRGFQISGSPEPSMSDVVLALKQSGADVMVNFLPVGSQEATEFYMECALEAGVAVVNCIPVFIASDLAWSERFRARSLPVVGDDIKAQIGATIVHRVLADLCSSRGINLKRTYQLNTGGNTDFMNMLDGSRLSQKKLSKTEAVQTALASRLADENIVIGPAEYVPWQRDNKVCFLRIEGEHWGGVPVNMEIRLSVEDSPNSAACVVDAIRFAKSALDKGEGGPLLLPSAYYCKHPPQQMEEKLVREMLNDLASQRGSMKVTGPNSSNLPGATA